jgi:hypothetical protein
VAETRHRLSFLHPSLKRRPQNNGLKLTKPAMANVPRASPLISVLSGP